MFLNKQNMLDSNDIPIDAVKLLSILNKTLYVHTQRNWIIYIQADIIICNNTKGDACNTGTFIIMFGHFLNGRPPPLGLIDVTTFDHEEKWLIIEGCCGEPGLGWDWRRLVYSERVPQNRTKLALSSVRTKTTEHLHTYVYHKTPMHVLYVWKQSSVSTNVSLPRDFSRRTYRPSSILSQFLHSPESNGGVDITLHSTAAYVARTNGILSCVLWECTRYFSVRTVLGGIKNSCGYVLTYILRVLGDVYLRKMFSSLRKFDTFDGESEELWSGELLDHANELLTLTCTYFQFSTS